MATEQQLRDMARHFAAISRNPLKRQDTSDAYNERQNRLVAGRDAAKLHIRASMAQPMPEQLAQAMTPQQAFDNVKHLILKQENSPNPSSIAPNLRDARMELAQAVLRHREQSGLPTQPRSMEQFGQDLKEDFPTAAKNLLGYTLGFPGDLASLAMTVWSRGGPTPDVPFTSDKIIDAIGGDVEHSSAFPLSLVAPGPGELATALKGGALLGFSGKLANNLEKEISGIDRAINLKKQDFLSRTGIFHSRSEQFATHGGAELHGQFRSEEDLIRMLAMRKGESPESYLRDWRALNREIDDLNDKRSNLLGREVRAEISERSEDKLISQQDNALLKFKQEAQGQGILDDMLEAGTSPGSVSNRFWDSVYPKLSGKMKEQFQDMIRALGFEPGDVMWVDKDGNRGIAKTWEELGGFLADDFPESVEHLEGSERGYVSLMEWANQQTLPDGPKRLK